MSSTWHWPKLKPYAWLNPAVLVGALVPLASLLWSATQHRLGANPIAEVLNRFGLLALIFLLASLACTPARAWLGWTWAARIRRLLGLLAFFYATLHLATYLLLDRWGELATLIEDIVKRPFITVGMGAWLLLVPLAATSTKRMVKRLGHARWQSLHRLSYAAALLAVLHFLWRVKKDASEPIVYGLVLLVLLALRFVDRRPRNVA